MKTAVITVIIAFMLVDTFVIWCLLRVNAMCEQNENKRQRLYSPNDTYSQ